jgi:hypothetical protein
MNQEVTYEEHLAFLDKQIEGALWERRGCSDARTVLAPVLPDDPYFAMRYKQGLNAGQVKLMVEGMVTA